MLRPVAVTAQLKGNTATGALPTGQGSVDVSDNIRNAWMLSLTHENYAEGLLPANHFFNVIDDQIDIGVPLLLVKFIQTHYEKSGFFENGSVAASSDWCINRTTKFAKDGASCVVSAIFVRGLHRNLRAGAVVTSTTLQR